HSSAARRPWRSTPATRRTPCKRGCCRRSGTAPPRPARPRRAPFRAFSSRPSRAYVHPRPGGGGAELVDFRTHTVRKAPSSRRGAGEQAAKGLRHVGRLLHHLSVGEANDVVSPQFQPHVPRPILLERSASP